MQKSDVIPLTNGCLCCTLSNDLALQLGDLVDTGEFDYIIIEASGICEPIPSLQHLGILQSEPAYLQALSRKP